MNLLRKSLSPSSRNQQSQQQNAPNATYYNPNVGPPGAVGRMAGMGGLQQSGLQQQLMSQGAQRPPAQPAYAYVTAQPSAGQQLRTGEVNQIIAGGGSNVRGGGAVSRGNYAGGNIGGGYGAGVYGSGTGVFGVGAVSGISDVGAVSGLNQQQQFGFGEDGFGEQQSAISTQFLREKADELDECVEAADTAAQRAEDNQKEALKAKAEAEKIYQKTRGVMLKFVDGWNKEVGLFFGEFWRI